MRVADLLGTGVRESSRALAVLVLMVLAVRPEHYQCPAALAADLMDLTVHLTMCP